jgi:hypothetical protein
MSTVVTYWQLPSDEQDFIEFLATTGDVVGLTDRFVERTEELLYQPITKFIEERNPDQLLLGLNEAELREHIAPRLIEGKLHYGVPHMQAPVIAYTRGRIRNGSLTLSNLSAYWEYPTEGGAGLVAKPREFVKWAKKVMAWARNASPEQLLCNGYPYRATARVTEAVRNSNFNVALY